MDLEASCKNTLASFRIKELKDVLTQLGLPKQGNKQDLVDRILTILSDQQDAKLWSTKNAVGREAVAKLVDDTYRKMLRCGANDLASKEQVSSETSSLKIKGEPEDYFPPDINVRCICGSSRETDSIIQCEDPRCHVWEHVGCVVVPENPTDGIPLLPKPFYCEICRLIRADPFWLTMGHPLFPVRLTATAIPTDGTNPMQTVERTFQITRAGKDLLVKQDYDVQAWCMLLNDKVLFRLQWPQYADLQVNGLPVRAINRSGSQLLGANGRDDGAIITHCIKDGVNNISLSGCDARIFCFGVRLVRRRTLQQVRNMIPEESKGEPLEEAIARVRRCIGGGAGDDNPDSDSDIEVVADFFGVNLRCPVSGSRMKVAGRFLPCVHMGCFDLEVFVEMNQRSRKWQCPICLKNYSVEDIIVDPYFNRITSKMKHCDEEVNEIEVKPCGSWRVKFKFERERRDLQELSLWHAPDGSLFPSVCETKPKMDMLNPVKQEGFSDVPSPLKLGIKKNRNGIWEVSKPNTNGLSSSNRQKNVGYEAQNTIPMSSSATGSSRDGDDSSVNQDTVRTFESGTPGIELDSISMNVGSGHNIPDRNQPAVSRNSEVIYLSDSDDEEDEVIITGGTNAAPIWSFPSPAPESTGFQQLASDADADVSEGLVRLRHGQLNSAPGMNGGYTMAPEASMASVHVDPDTDGRSEAIANDGLIDNPLAFGRDDPSLQIFLPTKSSATAQPDLRIQSNTSNGIRRDDWMSLRLGDSTYGNHRESVPANMRTSQQKSSREEDVLDTLTETGSFLD